jgi:hypothetical protein
MSWYWDNHVSDSKVIQTKEFDFEITILSAWVVFPESNFLFSLPTTFEAKNICSIYAYMHRLLTYIFLKVTEYMGRYFFVH